MKEKTTRHNSLKFRDSHDVFFRWFAKDDASKDAALNRFRFQIEDFRDFRTLPVRVCQNLEQRLLIVMNEFKGAADAENEGDEEEDRRHFLSSFWISHDWFWLIGFDWLVFFLRVRKKQKKNPSPVEIPTLDTQPRPVCVWRCALKVDIFLNLSESKNEKKRLLVDENMRIKWNKLRIKHSR